MVLLKVEKAYYTSGRSLTKHFSKFDLNKEEHSGAF